MPRLRTDAKASKIINEVSLSGDARAWAQQFAEQAAAATTRAQRAEERADAAEEHAEVLDQRCDHLEELQLKTAAYARVLWEACQRHGWDDVPEPPPDVEPFIKG